MLFAVFAPLFRIASVSPALEGETSGSGLPDCEDVPRGIGNE
jgi:hypothetical protein